MPKLTPSYLKRQISSHEDADWVPGETALSKLPEEEQDQHLGVVVPPGELERISSELEARAYEAVQFAPARDWRSVDGKDWTTPIRNQGPCGACVAFATVATIETQARIERKKADWGLDLSEADLFFCGGGRLCQRGWWPAEALKYAAAKGVPDDACFPYQAQDQACGSCNDRDARLLKVGSWQEIVAPDERKSWIDTKGPVVSCMAVYRDFFSYKQGVYRHVTGDLAGYHAISCVGYSEDEGCWICKNSWGPTWGDNGFFKVAYGQVEIDTNFAAWGVQNVKGTLKPDGGSHDDQASKLADYLVVHTTPDATGTMLFARVEGQWKHATISPQRLASLGPTVFAASAVSVKLDEDQIVGLSLWKQY